MKPNDLESIKTRLHEYLISKTDFLQKKDKLNEDQLRGFVDNAITALCQNAKIEIPLEDRLSLIRQLVSSVISLGPVRPLMDDDSVTEVMINGAQQVYVQRYGKMEKVDMAFRDNAELMHTIQKILSASETSRRVDESSPYVDFSLSDGSRVNVILPPCSLNGPVVTIRKFDTDIGTTEDLIGRKTMNQLMADFLVASIKAKLNIVFCGSTGCGKTTTLNVLSRHIPEDERIITIEDTSELRLLQEHVVSLQAKAANIEGRGEITIRDLFINSLRMRPDRIIVGEVRSHEILDMIQSISSGHSGSLSIIHADSPDECFKRMITMMLMSGIRLSGEEIQRQVAGSIDLIVYSELYMDGIRRIVNITDVSYDKKKDVTALEDIFTFEQKQVEGIDVVGDWVLHKKEPSSADKFFKHNVELPAEFKS